MLRLGWVLGGALRVRPTDRWSERKEEEEKE